MIIQLQVLNRILQSKSISILQMNNIDASYFSAYKDEYEFIINHYNKYSQIPDLVTFVDKFPNFDVIEVSESDKYLLDSLIESRQKQDLAKVFNKIRDALNDDNVNEAMNIYINSVSSAVQSKQIECVDILHDTSRYDTFVDKTQDFKKYFITTGFKELDDVLGGWDRHEDIVTLFARPGVGKSWVLLKCALAAAQTGLCVGLYSGEMSESLVGYRMDSLEGHISNYDLTRGNVSIINTYKQYIDELPTKYSGKLKIVTPKSLQGEATVTALRAFAEKEHLDMLCIDQYSLLDDEHHGRTDREKTANISKALKNLQVAKQIPIIAVSQQNRESTEETGTTLANIAVSDRIGQDSTIVIALTQKDNVLKLELIKTRNSPTGKTLSYTIELNKGIFQYIPEESSAVGDAGVKELEDEFEGGEVF